MRRTVFGAVVVAVAVGTSALAEGLKPDGSPDLAVLKGQTVFRMNPVDYDGLLVGKRKRIPEEQYLRENKKNRPEALESWERDKQVVFPEAFQERFNAVLKERVGVTISSDAKDAKYAIQLKVLMIEPGWKIGFGPGSSRPALVDFVVTIVETAAPGKVVASFTHDRCVGRGSHDYSLTRRVSLAFSRCGRDVANYLFRNVYKPPVAPEPAGS